MKSVGWVNECKSDALRPMRVHHRYPLRSIQKGHRDSLPPTQQGHRYPLRSLSIVSKQKCPIIVIKDIDSVNTRVAKTKSKLHFFTLNDNCILYVLEHLSLADLCTTAEVSVRLKQMAQYYFRLKYRDLDMRLLVDGNNKISMAKARKLFHHFGHLITSLRVSRKDFMFDDHSNDRYKGQSRLFRLIRKNCTLNSLTLRHFWLTMGMIRKSIPIFQTLTTLNFYRLSCYCKKEKKFYNFANALRMVFEQKGIANRVPQSVQLV